MSKKLITLSVCLIATTLAFGQKKEIKKISDTVISLDEVIVTANKVEQKQNATGKVVTVINAAALQANAGRSIAQILNGFFLLISCFLSILSNIKIFKIFF